MKIFAMAFIVCISLFAKPVVAQSSEIQTDILVQKIASLIQSNRHAEALPYFQQLEQSGAKLTEVVYFRYIDALDKSSQIDAAVAKGKEYLEKFSNKGKYYGQVIEIISRRSIEQDLEKSKQAEQVRLLQIEAEKKKRAIAAQIDADRTKYDRELEEFKKSVANCEADGFIDTLNDARNRYRSAQAACTLNTGRNFCDANESNGQSSHAMRDSSSRVQQRIRVRRTVEELESTNAVAWCSDRYERPKMPASLR